MERKIFDNSELKYLKNSKIDYDKKLNDLISKKEEIKKNIFSINNNYVDEMKNFEIYKNNKINEISKVIYFKNENLQQIIQQMKKNFEEEKTNLIEESESLLKDEKLKIENFYDQQMKLLKDNEEQFSNEWIETNKNYEKLLKDIDTIEASQNSVIFQLENINHKSKNDNLYYYLPREKRFDTTDKFFNQLKSIIDSFFLYYAEDLYNDNTSTIFIKDFLENDYTEFQNYQKANKDKSVCNWIVCFFFEFIMNKFIVNESCASNIEPSELNYTNIENPKSNFGNTIFRKFIDFYESNPEYYIIFKNQQINLGSGFTLDYVFGIMFVIEHIYKITLMIENKIINMKYIRQQFEFDYLPDHKKMYFKKNKLYYGFDSLEFFEGIKKATEIIKVDPYLYVNKFMIRDFQNENENNEPTFKKQKVKFNLN